MIDLHPTFPVPSLDPDPALTERFRSAGAFERRAFDGALTDDAIAAIRSTLQSVVNGLQSDEQSFRAVFGKGSTAATDMVNRIVHIGTKIMDDPTISDGRLAAAMVGLAFHEVAHINHDRDFTEVVARVAWGHPLGDLAAKVSNIAQDVRIERKQRPQYPGYADCLDVAMYFINGEPMRQTVPPPVGLSKEAARSLYFAAVRAPWCIADWNGAPKVRAWGDDWIGRFSATDAPEVIETLLTEALDTIGSWMAPDPTAPPPVEPPVIDEPPIIDEPPPVGPPQPPGPEGDDEDPPEGPGGDDPFDDDEDPPEGPDGEDEDPPVDEPKPTEGGDPTEDEGPEGPTTPKGGDPTKDAPEVEPSDDESSDDEDRDLDTSGEFNPDNGTFDAPSVTAPSDDTEGVDTDKALEDIPFPECAGEALRGLNDLRYDIVATRVEKSREASNVRIIRTPGWPDRKVRRIRDWTGKDA